MRHLNVGRALGGGLDCGFRFDSSTLRIMAGLVTFRLLCLGFAGFFPRIFQCSSSVVFHMEDDWAARKCDSALLQALQDYASGITKGAECRNAPLFIFGQAGCHYLWKKRYPALNMFLIERSICSALTTEHSVHARCAARVEPWSNLSESPCIHCIHRIGTIKTALGYITLIVRPLYLAHGFIWGRSSFDLTTCERRTSALC